jgi:hypothetical protein
MKHIVSVYDVNYGNRQLPWTDVLIVLNDIPGKSHKLTGVVFEFIVALLARKWAYEGR